VILERLFEIVGVLARTTTFLDSGSQICDQRVEIAHRFVVGEGIRWHDVNLAEPVTTIAPR
jgi:hypothetical protein